MPAVKCHYCGEDAYLPFRCAYCGQQFCVKHRLPEGHECSRRLEARAPRERPTEAVERRLTYAYEYPSYLRALKAKVPWFSLEEQKHLVIGSLLVLAVGLFMCVWLRDLHTSSALAALFTASFLTHELAHKAAARLQGLWAEFRVIPFGALITLISAFTPWIKIISPGAVITTGLASSRDIGKTALAGPLTNLALSTTFALAAPLAARWVAFVLAHGAWINAIMALFNMMPFGALDGLKVIYWSRKAWAISFVLSAALTAYVRVVML